MKKQLAQLATEIIVDLGSDFEKTQKIVSILEGWKVDAHLLSRSSASYSVTVKTPFCEANNALGLIQEAIEMIEGK